MKCELNIRNSLNEPMDDDVPVSCRCDETRQQQQQQRKNWNKMKRKKIYYKL